MAPFYSPPGISLNGTQVLGLAIQGNGAVTDINSGVGTIGVNGFNVSNGTLTIDNPTMLNLSGSGQVLTLGALAPSVVQVSTFAQGYGGQTASLTNPPAIGNIVLAFAFADNGNYGFTGAPWTEITTNAGGMTAAYCVCNAENQSTIQHLNVNTGDNFSIVFALVEVENAGPVVNGDFINATGSISGSVYESAAQTMATSNLILMLLGAQQNSGPTATLSTPTPAGASIVQSIVQTPIITVQAALLSFVGDGASHAMSITSSDALTAGAAALMVSIPYMSANITANLAIT